VSPVKTAKPIDMPFERATRVQTDRPNHTCQMGSRSPTGMGNLGVVRLNEKHWKSMVRRLRSKIITTSTAVVRQPAAMLQSAWSVSHCIPAPWKIHPCAAAFRWNCLNISLFLLKLGFPFYPIPFCPFVYDRFPYLVTCFQPTDSKSHLKGAWSWSRDLFKFW